MAVYWILANMCGWGWGYLDENETIEAVKDVLESLGFRLRRLIATAAPAGCDRFIFASLATAPR